MCGLKGCSNRYLWVNRFLLSHLLLTFKEKSDQELPHFFVGMSVLGIIEINPRVHSLCLFWSDWRKVCATSAAVAGGNPGPVPEERGTWEGAGPRAQLRQK
jgi:hypothetical protein